MTRKLLLELSATSEAELNQAAESLKTISQKLNARHLKALADIARTRPELLDKAMQFLKSPFAKTL